MIPELEQSQILPAKDFDTGTKTASAPIKAQMQGIYATAKEAGLDIEALIQQAESASKIETQALLGQLHDVATILFLRWQDAQQRDASIESLAIARIFNSVTGAARHLDRCHSLIDKSHLDALKSALEQDFKSENYDPARTARYMDTAAKLHTHEKAWAWVILPTFARQPYGRILLFKLEVPRTNFNIFVTQPFFLAGKATLCHTHGRNWAFSRPLGTVEKNTHLNTMWLPRSPEVAFPLRQVDFAEYYSDAVAVMPPKTIHAISRKRPKKKQIPSLQELIQNPELIADTRFGEMSCMHLYRPHLPLVKELEASPLVTEDERFFIENDMIVFDHTKKSIWAGGGGAWAQRMIDFGTTGEHCGICYEDDPRRENLDPEVISQWLVDNPAPSIQVVSASQ